MIMAELDKDLEDGFFDDPIDNGQKETEISPAQESDIPDLFRDEPIKESNNDSIISDLLKAKGINDGKITILDEKNGEEVVDFFSLPKEEQLEILNQRDDYQPNDTDLDDSEIELINQIRSKGQSVEEYLNDYRNQVLSEQQDQNAQQYTIDAYSDEELYLLDLKNKYGDQLSDEELVNDLNKEKENPDLFSKKASALRTEYKELEDRYNEAQKQEFEAKQEQDFNEFSQTMTDVAINTPEFYGIELEDDEKNEVLSFLLDIDDNGMSEFHKSLNDPAKLYEAAWFLRYGKQSFDAIKSAYETEISRLKKQDDKPTVIHTPSQGKNNPWAGTMWGID